MNNLLTLQYWFNLLPGPWLAEYLRIIYTIFIVMVILGLVAWLLVVKNKHNKLMLILWKKIQHIGLTIGLSGLILIFFRQQGIYFLSMPVLMLLLVIGFIVWIYYIYKYVTKTLPLKKRDQENKQIKEKYLP